MKNLLLVLISLFTFTLNLVAQEIDTIPIPTKDLDIKLKRSHETAQLNSVANLDNEI